MSDDKARKLVNALIDCYDIVGEYPRKPYEALLAYIEAETARADAAERERDALREAVEDARRKARKAEWYADNQREKLAPELRAVVESLDLDALDGDEEAP